MYQKDDPKPKKYCRNCYRYVEKFNDDGLCVYLATRKNNSKRYLIFWEM